MCGIIISVGGNFMCVGGNLVCVCENFVSVGGNVMCVGGNIGQAYFNNIISTNTHDFSANTHEIPAHDISAHDISANTNVTINRLFESQLWKTIRANLFIIVKIILVNQVYIEIHLYLDRSCDCHLKYFYIDILSAYTV